MRDEINHTIAALEPVSLDDLEREASLERRVDEEFLLPAAALGELIERDAAIYRVLVAGRRPRYQARTRYYRATETCVFEVELKRADGETDKRSIDYEAGRGADRLRLRRGGPRSVRPRAALTVEEAPGRRRRARQAL